MPASATPDTLDRKLLDAVERLGHALRAARQRIATDLGLTSLQVGIIERLDHLDALPIGRLARELDVSQPTVSDSVATLVDKGLLARRRSAQDGRITLSTLTTDGLRVAERIQDALRPLYPTQHESSIDERGVALSVLLDEILRLQRAGVITVNRSCFSCHHYQPSTTTTSARCLLLDAMLTPAELRVDCPDHRAN